MATYTTKAATVTSRLATQAVLVDISQSGRLLVSGIDAIDLLNRLSTNDLEQLRPGQGIGTVLTTNKGRIIDLLRVLHRGDDLLILASPGTQTKVTEWVDFYTFAEDVRVTDITSSTRQFLVMGNGAARTLERVGYPMTQLTADLSNARAARADGEHTVTRVRFGDICGYEVVTPLVGLPAELESETLDEPDFARLRVEQGVAAYPNEMNENRNPLEANLKPHINFNKGCYIGQEVVARLNTYDRVQRFLCQLSVDDGSTVEPGAEVVIDGDRAGEVTSSVPGLALAFLRKRFYEDGAAVSVSSGDGLIPATVRDIRPPEENE